MTRTRISLPSLIHGVSQLNSATRQPVHALDCINTWPNVEHGDQKRPPTIHVANVYNDVFGNAYVHGINRSSTEQYIVMVNQGGATTSGRMFTPAGTSVGVRQLGAGGYYTDAPVWTYLASASPDPSKNIRALSVLDYTFVVNRQKAVTMDTATLTAANPLGVAHIFIRQGLYAMKYTVKWSEGGVAKTASVTTGKSVGAVTPPQLPDPADGTFPTVKTQDIANGLLAAMIVSANTATAKPITVGSYVTGSVIKVKTDSGANFDYFEVSSSQGDSLAFGIWNDIADFGYLPLVYTHDYVVRIKGNSSDTLDDYYIKFVSDTASATLSKGVWEECLKPATAYRFFPTIGVMNPATHPHALVRRVSDVNNGPAPVGTVYFSWEPIGLTSRAVGDTLSNRVPGFVSTTGTGGSGASAFTVSRTIQDASFFRDRLVFTSDENVVASEQGQYFNFFRTTVRAVPPSDPVDVSLTSDQVTVIHSAIPFGGKLVLFSAEAQHVFSGSPNLTPDTVEAVQVSRYQNTSACRPVAYENGIYFACTLGSYTGLKSLAASNQVENHYIAEDLTLHVPAFISGTAIQIAVSTDSSVTAVLASGARDTIYILKQHREGTQVVQSAWTKFVLDDSTILGIVFFGTKLYIVNQHTNAVYLEYIDLSPGVVDVARDYWIHLDRRVTFASGSGSVNFNGTDTLISMPYVIYSDSSYEVVSTSGTSALTRYTAQYHDGVTVKVSGNITGRDLLVGVPYTSTHSFHKPQVMITPQQGQRLILDSTSAVIALEIRYENTSYFSVVVGSDTTPVGSTSLGFDSTYPENGTVFVGVGGRLDMPFAVSVQNPTPFPHTLVSAEWLLNATVRSAPVTG